MQARAVITIEGDSGDLEAAVRHASKALDRLEDGMKGAGQQAKAATAPFLGFQSLMKGGLAIGGTLALMDALGNAMNFVRESAIGLNARLEQVRIGLETMTGSALVARGELRRMAEFAAETPFEFEGLVQAHQRLLAFGFSLGEILPTLRTLGDAVAGLGGDPEKLDRVINAVGQIQAKGRLAAEELLQLTEAGIPAFEILQQKLGLSAQQLQNIGKEGIAADKAIRALLEGLEERFGGMMERQSRSMRGLFSTLRDELSLLLADVFRPTADLLTEKILPTLVETVHEVRESRTEWGQLKLAQEEVARVQAQVVQDAERYSRQLIDLSERTKVWGARITDLDEAWHATRVNIERVTEAFERLEDRALRARLAAHAQFAEILAREQAEKAQEQQAQALRRLTESATAATKQAKDLDDVIRERLRESISALDARIGMVRDRFQLWAIEHDAAEESAGFLQARIQSLQTEMGLLQQKIEATRKAYLDMAQAKGANSTAALELQKSLTGLQVEYAKLGQAVDETKQKLVDLAREAHQAALDTLVATVDIAAQRMGMEPTEVVAGMVERIQEAARRLGFGDIPASLIKKNLHLFFSGGGFRSAIEQILQHVPRMAEGGIVTRPTLAVVGERGPEAVVPLRSGVGGVRIDRVEINIYDATDPQKVARIVDRQIKQTLVELARVGARAVR